MFLIVEVREIGILLSTFFGRCGEHTQHDAREAASDLGTQQTGVHRFDIDVFLPVDGILQIIHVLVSAHPQIDFVSGIHIDIIYVFFVNETFYLKSVFYHAFAVHVCHAQVVMSVMNLIDSEASLIARRGIAQRHASLHHKLSALLATAYERRTFIFSETTHRGMQPQFAVYKFVFRHIWILDINPLRSETLNL